MKTNKSYTKRLRQTKRGKVVARATGQNHFNAKNSGKRTMQKRRAVTLTLASKIQSRFLPN